MAKYKVWLTVKDSYGNTKEVDAGDIAVDFTLGQEELDRIEEQLPLDEFLKKAEIDETLGHYATDEEVAQAAKEAAKTAEVVKYASFDFYEKTEEEGE